MSHLMYLIKHYAFKKPSQRYMYRAIVLEIGLLDYLLVFRIFCTSILFTTSLIARMRKVKETTYLLTLLGSQAQKLKLVTFWKLTT